MAAARAAMPRTVPPSMPFGNDTSSATAAGVRVGGATTPAGRVTVRGLTQSLPSTVTSIVHEPASPAPKAITPRQRPATTATEASRDSPVSFRARMPTSSSGSEVTPASSNG
jgi:hypothetical protein